ncbi:unnamed protein product [Onchocerca flexuosa]|uniref:Uncharacterized protein n=1 Tax=Onchocerca flexuosa TaxID=387005 RepID=A0A183HKR9_9BILA|nr:unnamed protein product [Onchocerca flexuosa]
MVAKNWRKGNAQKKLEYDIITIRNMNIVSSFGIPDVPVMIIDFTISILAKRFAIIFHKN